MLNLFPQLLFLAPFSAFMIRVAVAFVVGNAAIKHFHGSARPSSRITSVIEGIAAALLLLGIYTQASALAASVLMLAWLFTDTKRPYAKSTIALAVIMALSLVFTGAGPFAFDFPF